MQKILVFIINFLQIIFTNTFLLIKTLLSLISYNDVESKNYFAHNQINGDFFSYIYDKISILPPLNY